MRGVFPEVVFTVMDVPVRDTVISTWFTMLLILAMVFVVRRRWPGALGILVSWLLENVSAIMGERADPYISLLGTLAVFIGVANAIGAVPIVVSPTHDINTTAALALIVFFSVHYLGVKQKGLLGYLKGLATPLFTLPLELIGQLSRTLSLALRLFGNVLSTEMVVAVIFSLLPLIVPVPLIAFGIFTGVLQAYIFTVLAAVYIAAAVAGNEPVKTKKKKG